MTKQRGRPAGQEKTGGRVAGTPNKVTAPLKELAAQFSEQALEILIDIMNDTTAPHQTRVNAANSVLDRAVGKPAIAVEVEATHDHKIDLAAIDKQLEEAAKIRAERRAELEARGLIGRFNT